VTERRAPQRDPAGELPEPPGVRFDATIHAPKGSSLRERLDELEIDRVPDARGKIRALVTADDLARIVGMGFEVRLHRAHPIGPLDRRLVATDASVRRWLEAGLEGIDHPALARSARPAKPRKPRTPR
jgi:hypothetical protein